ncbi:cholinesterase-like [Dermacentor variabilis]|uniref:cholinesterase-like n=1 Tax=Dermacentor variabilis TaxID=34621 RepID=UPI003F5B6E39
MPSRRNRSRSTKAASRLHSSDGPKTHGRPWEGRLITTARKQVVPAPVMSPAAEVTIGPDDDPHLPGLHSLASVSSAGLPSHVETRSTASKKSSNLGKKESMEALKAGPSRPGTGKHCAIIAGTDRESERTATMASKCQFNVRSATEGTKKAGFAKPETPVHHVRQRVPTPCGTPDYLRRRPTTQPTTTFGSKTGAHVVNIGGSVLLFVFIFLLSAYFMWPRSRNTRRKSSGGTTSSNADRVTTHQTSACTDAAQLSVWIDSGEIRGWRSPGTVGAGKKPVRQFFGIPYGRSTSGVNRFNYAVGTDMPGTFQADQHGPHCFQNSTNETLLDEMREECLTLSIWAPFLCTREESLKTVLVVVSSEWFQTGHVSDHEKACLEIASADVVVVAINFRLGVFGFLRTPWIGMPSNAGFSDLVRALTWLRTKVAAFHGDPKTMVGLGVGSGGVLLSLDLLTPNFRMAAFFKRLILHGLVAGSLLPRNIGMDNAKMIAANLKECAGTSKTTDATAVLQCLRNVSARTLLEASATMTPPLRFVPNLDSNTGSGRPSFGAVAPWSAMPLRPLKDVSVLCGYSKEDGQALFDDEIAKSEGISERTPPRHVIGRLVHFFTMRSAPKLFDELPDSAVESLEKNAISGAVDFLADALYYCPLVEMATAITKMKGVAYVYGNVKRQVYRPMMNLNYTIAFAKSGKVPWSAFGDTKAVYVDNGTHPDVFFNWRYERCSWVQELSRRLQVV